MGQGAGARQPLALLGQQALVLQVAQHVLQPDAVVALQREGLGDVALAGLVGILGDELAGCRRASAGSRPWRQSPCGRLRPCSCRRCVAPSVLRLFLRRALLGCRLFLGGRLLCGSLLGGGLLGRRPCGPASCRRRSWQPFRRSGQRLLERHRHRVLALRQRRVDLAAVHIGPVFAVAHGDLAAAIGMVAEFLQRRRRAAAPRRGPWRCFSAITVTARLRPIENTSSMLSRLA